MDYDQQLTAKLRARHKQETLQIKPKPAPAPALQHQVTISPEGQAVFSRLTAALEALAGPRPANEPAARDPLWRPSAADLANPPWDQRLPWTMTVGVHHPSRGWITRAVIHRQELLLLSHGIDPRTDP